MMSDEYGLCLADRLQIQDVIHRWCRAVDRLDLASIETCFHPDAHDDHVFYRGDIPGLVECLAQRHRSISFSSHAVSNVLVEFVSAELALAESYVRVTQRRPIDPDQRSEAGGHDSQISDVHCRYLDRFTKVNGRWRIAHRTLVIDAAMEYSDREPLHRLPPAESGNRGRRDGSDALWLQRHSMGLDTDTVPR
jgi:hypothetical protein